MTPAMALAYREEEAAGRAPIFSEVCERAVLARLRSMEETDFAALDSGQEGLETACTAPAEAPPPSLELRSGKKPSDTPMPACGGLCCGPIWD